TVIRKDSAIEPAAMPPISFSEKRNFRTRSPLMAAPARGNNGTSQMYLYIESKVQCPKSNVRKSNLTLDFGPWTTTSEYKSHRSGSFPCCDKAQSRFPNQLLLPRQRQR